MIEIEVRLIFDTPPNVGSGAQAGTLADRAFIKDRNGWPYIPATTLKGQLRHAVERVAQGMGHEVCDTHHHMCREGTVCPVCAIFGSPWIAGRLRFENLELNGPEELMEHLNKLRREKRHPRTGWRYGVALSRCRGVAEDALLYTTELFMPGIR
jgi:CRISPR/Cas system CSM-associated protein Csm3 (group 7 of RAMP superfamily)